MTDTTALRDLLANVKAGIWIADRPRPISLHTDLVWKAFNRSTDAAIALCRSAVPGWDWVLTDDSAELYQKQNASVTFLNGGEPARALLICIIEALIWEAGNHDVSKPQNR